MFEFDLYSSPHRLLVLVLAACVKHSRGLGCLCIVFKFDLNFPPHRLLVLVFAACVLSNKHIYNASGFDF